MKLKAKPTKAGRGKLAKFTLKAKRGASAALLRVLGRVTAEAKLRVTLQDAAGNKTTLKKSVLLLPG